MSSKSPDRGICLTLPDDILLYLMRFLSDAESLALAISNVFDGFAFLHGKKKSFRISKCYSLTPCTLNTFVSRWICPHDVHRFDASHCYWLPSRSLVDIAALMPELVELNLDGIKLSLTDLQYLLGSCPKVTQLTVTLLDSVLGETMQKAETFTSRELFPVQAAELETLALAFGRLTHLKLLTVAFNARYYIDTWLSILSILSWCRNCVDLHVEISYTRDYFCYGMPYDSSDHDQEVIETAEANLLPKLDWFDSLKSFVFVKRGAHKLPHDIFVPVLLNWMFTERRMISLQRLWVQEYSVRDLGQDQLVAPSVLSLLLGNLEIDTSTERYRRLEHVGGIGFARLDHLPHIRYARGYAVDVEGFQEFCRAHPLLEHLCFDANYFSVRLDRGWQLVKLKRLVYACGSPSEEIVRKIVEACPNVEELHIGELISGGGSVTSDGVDFLKEIRFERLTVLTFSGFDMFQGSFLRPILTACSRLRSLHLCGIFEPKTFLSNLCRCLPLAGNLRDLRLQWEHQEDDSDLLLLLTSLSSDCSYLHRLVLCQEEMKWSNQPEWDPPECPSSAQQTDFIVNFAAKMGRLVALCLTSLKLSSSVIGDVNRRIADEILPLRPSFWWYVDLEMPKENDSSVPRVHYDEIVNPVNYFDSPPDFKCL